VAVADNANLFGAMAFCAAAKKAGVQPIVAALMPLAAPDPATAARAAPGRQADPEHVALWSRTPPATRTCSG
jgi:DNA polymerase III alpha subunit